MLLSGCALSTSDADTERGRQLYIQNCGACHILAEAATSGVQGPDLDAAFAESRASGMDSDTIEGVVATQIENPRPSVEGNPLISMPADIVTGQDLEDVAAYVASVAGVPGAAPPEVPGGPGAQVFANNGCGGCHVLAAANAGGTTGPDLDEILPGQSATQIEESIVDPNAELTPGFPANLMPSNFGQLISPEDLELLVEYLISSTSEGAGQ